MTFSMGDGVWGMMTHCLPAFPDDKSHALVRGFA